MNKPVVVGVDGSEPSLDAVDTAADEARLRGLGLHVVHAYLPHLTDVPPGVPAPGPTAAVREQTAGQIVAEAEERARHRAPDIEVSCAAVVGEALPVLLDQARDASLTVVASRGRTSFSRLMVGSVAVHLAAHTPSPLLVVRGGQDPAGEVLLGVDGSPSGEPAVRFAFEEAALRGVPLVGLHVWSEWTTPVGPPADRRAPYSQGPGVLRAGEERLLAEALAGWRDKYPEVLVRQRLVRGRAREALIAASESAQLVVVGSRGRGGFPGLLLGSASHAMVHHAHAPVAVVPRG